MNAAPAQPQTPKKGKGKNASKKAQKTNRTELVQQLKPRNAFRLSPCGEKYLDSLLDPFEGPTDACVPNWPSFPSGKLRVFSRGALTIGTAGMGFLLGRPSLSADNPSGAYSTATYAGTTCAITGTGVSSSSPNSPYLQASFGAGSLSQRLVSMGIRVRYTGTELNRGGAIYALENPSHATLTGMAIPDLRAFNGCHGFPVDKDWTQICWMPITPAELEYYFSGYAPNPNGSSDNVNYPLALAIQSTAGNSFEFEIFGNYEVMGSAVRDKTSSDTDTTALSVVSGTLRSTNDGQLDRRVVTLKDKNPRPGRSIPSLVKSIGNYAFKQLSGFIQSPEKVAGLAGLVAPMLMA